MYVCGEQAARVVCGAHLRATGKYALVTLRISYTRGNPTQGTYWCGVHAYMYVCTYILCMYVCMYVCVIGTKAAA